MVTMKDIQSIREDLKKRKPANLASNSDRPLTNKEAVKQLAPTLFKMIERSFTTNALVELLKEHQITIKGRDLSRYLREFKGENLLEAKSDRPKKPPAKPAVSSPEEKAKPEQTPAKADS